MVTIILYSVFSVLIFFTVKQALKTIKEHGYTYLGFLKEIYLKNLSAYGIAFLMVFVLFSSIIMVVVFVPQYVFDSLSFMKFGLFSLFGEEPINIVAKPITESSRIETSYQPFYLLSLLIGFIFLLPILAYNEEVAFRSYKLQTKEMIKSSFIFAIIHIIMGIPLFVLPILFIIGLTLSFLYSRKYFSQPFKKETIDNDMEQANLVATMHVGRIHTLYNFTLLGLVILSYLLLI